MKLPQNINDWPKEWRENFEERAGILEYEANLPRAAAESWAEIYVRDLYAESWESLT